MGSTRLHCVAWALLLATPGTAADREWIEVASPHFRVLSDAGEKSARKMAWQFEQVHSVLHNMWPWARTEPGRPFVVLAVRGEKSLRELAPEYWEGKGGFRPAGVFVGGAGQDFVAIRTDLRDPQDNDINPYDVAFSGYVHILLGASFPKPLPMWLQRGLTEVFGNTLVRTQDVHVGRIIPHYLERMREGMRLPLAELLRVDRSSKYATNSGEREIFDAQAWLFVHYLSFGEEGALRPRLSGLMSRLHGGMDAEQTIAESLGPLDALQSGLGKYISHSLFGYGRLDIDIDIDSKAFPLRTLPPEESAAERARFHVAMDREPEALALIAAAKAVAPESPLAYEAEGVLLDGRDDDAGAIAAYRKAYDLGSRSAHALVRLASLSWRQDADAPTLQLIVDALERATQATPDRASTHDWLAGVRLQLDDSAEGAVPALASARRAVELEPDRARYRLNLALALWRGGSVEKAREEARIALTQAQDAADRQRAAELLAYFDRATPPPPSEGS